MVLKDKKVLIGVSGSIAAYKAALIVRLLVKEGASVKVIMTKAATEFISPLTLSTLSKNDVYSHFSNSESGSWHNHVELGLWADIFLIAPASANTIAKCAHGICDNLLIATYLSAKCKVVFAPAMDLDMFAHPSTFINLKTLSSYGNLIIEPEDGELASGLEGKGRLAEPEILIDELKKILGKETKLTGKNVLISAGPTQENIDPVRFISNHSTGKMGYEIAEAFLIAGANVTLVSGPVAIKAMEGANIINVIDAAQMLEAMQNNHKNADIVIFAAAVADYGPAEVAKQKIKKKASEMSIELKKTVDIAATLGNVKSSKQIHVGFALETYNELINAKDKLTKKNFDMIVLNSLQDKGAGFRYDTNKITILDKKGAEIVFELKSKALVAQDIKNAIIDYILKHEY